MSCHTIQEQLAQASLGFLDAKQVIQLEAHLAQCPACRQFAGQLERSHEALRNFLPTMRKEFQLGGVAQTSHPFVWQLFPRWLAAGVAACIFGLSGLLWTQWQRNEAGHTLNQAYYTEAWRDLGFEADNFSEDFNFSAYGVPDAWQKYLRF
jgi:predicted anti-sigma-YlaC factor YlaD